MMRFTQTQLTKLQQQYIKVHLEDPALLRALYGFAAVSLEGSLPLPVRLSLSLSLSLSRSLAHVRDLFVEECGSIYCFASSDCARKW